MICGAFDDERYIYDDMQHLDAIDRSASTQETLVSLGPPFKISSIAFSPDMSFALIGEVTNGIHTVLNFWVQDRGLQGNWNIVHTATLAPSWSPGGEWAAFIGTRDIDINGIGRFDQADWKLYAAHMSPRPQYPTDYLLVEGIEYPEQTQWFPDNETIAFSATVDGTEGIWMVNRRTTELRRVWPRQAWFDLFPDGSRMLIADFPPWDDDYARAEPLIITLPPLSLLSE